MQSAVKGWAVSAHDIRQIEIKSVHGSVSSSGALAGGRTCREVWTNLLERSNCGTVTTRLRRDGFTARDAAATGRDVADENALANSAAAERGLGAT